MRILVDMDGVLEDLLTPWCEWLNREHGTNVNPEDITEWDVSKFFPSLTRNKVYGPMHSDEFWKDVKPIPGAVEGMKKLIDAGHEVYVVTTSDYRTLKSKMDNVLFKYFKFLTWKNVIITSYKYLVNGDVLIDDGIHNFANGAYEKIVFDAPHNRIPLEIEQDLRLNRAHNWSEVVALVDRMSEYRQWLYEHPQRL